MMFDLKKVKQMAEHQLVVMRLGFPGSCIKNVIKLGAVEKIYRETMEVSSLEHTG
jgi:hypothetical protein